MAADVHNVFLNLPYHKDYERLFVAYIAGIAALGLTPRTALEVTSGARRLDRIWGLLLECRSSVHDLSYLRHDLPAPRTPRFNMPFELGLACGLAQQTKGHEWFVFERQSYRVQKSLSDINGTDPFIHHGTVKGVLAELNNAFLNARRQPSLAESFWIYTAVRKEAPNLLRQAGSTTVFAPRVFKWLAFRARELAARIQA
ncbi:MAG: hypothetical protein GC160_18265 [Acidobacteria bacterium]|nr:hypothetical protein [Acidobacteriota bacterium]